MDNPLISIIIPVYNAEAYIEETIQSAINQTWQNKELIIIDDGSTDNSLKIAKKFQSDNVKIFSQPNKGASAARNLGLNYSKGDFIQFLDADDILSLNKIENQVLALIHNPYSIGVCSTVHFFDGEEYNTLFPDKYEDSFLTNYNDPIEFIIKLWGGCDGKGSMIQPNAWLTPKRIIDKAGCWNENLTVDDDGDFFCRVILNANEIIYTNKIFNYYRKHKKGNNLSSQLTKNAITSIFTAICLKESHLSKIKTDKTFQQIFNSMYFRFAVNCYPKYKSTTKLAQSKIKGNFVKKPQLYLGGKIIDFIANNISWKLARYIQHIRTIL